MKASSFDVMVAKDTVVKITATKATVINDQYHNLILHDDEGATVACFHQWIYYKAVMQTETEAEAINITDVTQQEAA